MSLSFINFTCILYYQDLDEEEMEELTEKALSMSQDMDFKDDGYIELVLRVLGLMCDNQYKGLQVSKLCELLQDSKIILLPLSTKLDKKNPEYLNFDLAENLLDTNK